jgi:N-succinyldiaminopimelate aminotransferase
MNPLLARLQPYPFEQLRRLTRDVVPPASLRPIGLGIGEPKHATPDLVLDAMRAHLDGLARYPATAGEPALREACAGWVRRRYGVELDPATQVLPVNGSREALFALAQTVIDPGRPGATVVCPNPFYQIYEGAALLAGAQPHFAPSDPERNFAVDWSQVPEAVWARTQLLYVCSPGNPTGAVMPIEEWQRLFELSDRYGFVIASDECYSEIWFREPPLGSLEAARRLGRPGFERLVAFTSLSKRSNVPGLRSGFVAGDAAILKAFLLYRTYHGSAMSPTVQHASAAAWGDEGHVEANRALYRRKFEAVTPRLASVLDVAWPDAGFYLWADVQRVTGREDVAVPGLGAAVSPDVAFARDLLALYNVAVLPGSLLAREAPDATAGGGARNPGRGRIRLALVAPVDECVEAADRIVDFCRRSTR